MKRKYMKGAFRYDWDAGVWVARRPSCWTIGKFDMKPIMTIRFPELRIL